MKLLFIPPTFPNWHGYVHFKQALDEHVFKNQEHEDMSGRFTNMDSSLIAVGIEEAIEHADAIIIFCAPQMGFLQGFYTHYAKSLKKRTMFILPTSMRHGEIYAEICMTMQGGGWKAIADTFVFSKDGVESFISKVKEDIDWLKISIEADAQHRAAQ